MILWYFIGFLSFSLIIDGFSLFEPQTRIFFGYPQTVHESPVTDQHESSVEPKWNEFLICTSTMCQSIS